jgi:hypothetical protein
MSLDSYQSALESARTELGQIARQRELLDRRMTQLTRIIESLIPLIESEMAIEVGSAAIEAAATRAGELPSSIFDHGSTITEATKKVFDVFGTGPGGEDVPLTPLDVRGGLTVAGWDLSQHKNPMATIHSILKRLVEQDVLEATEKDGKPAYIRARGKYLRRFAELTTTFNESMRTWAEDMRQQTEQAREAIGEAFASVVQTVRDANLSKENLSQIGEAISEVAQQVAEANAKTEQTFAAIAEQLSKPMVYTWPSWSNLDAGRKSEQKQIGPKPEKKS